MSFIFDLRVPRCLEHEIISFLSNDDLTSFEQTSRRAKQMVPEVITERWKKFPVVSPENNESRPYIHEWTNIHGLPRERWDIVKLSAFLTGICIQQSGKAPPQLLSAWGPELYDRVPKAIMDKATVETRNLYEKIARSSYGKDKMEFIQRGVADG